MCAVSIPERVLGWLKQVGVSREIVFVDVSIPERVLGWLKRYQFLGFKLMESMFQSLKGFWVG